MKRFLAAVVCVLATAAPARSAVNVPVRTDGLDFPVYPHAVVYAVFGPNIEYLVGGDVERVTAWYRQFSGRPWTIDSSAKHGRSRSIDLSFTDGFGTHRLRIAGTPGGSVVIAESLDLSFLNDVVAQAKALALRGAADPLGTPLYPNRSAAKAVVLVDGSRGLVSYGTRDAFDTVFRWFNAHLSNRYALSYDLNDADTKMRTFHGGNTSVTITRRVSDGGLTVIGVARSD